jgi:hypothetical protein
MAKRWYRVIAKEPPNERQHVECDPATVRQMFPASLYFMPREIDGPPGECDDYSMVEGRMKRDEKKAKAVAREGQLTMMSNTEFFEAVVAEAIRRIKEEGSKDPSLSAKLSIG